MRWNWPAVLLAPLFVPVVAAAAMSVFLAPNQLLYSFLIFLLIGSFISYGITYSVFLPVLFVFSHRITFDGKRASLLGLILGIIVYFPMMFVTWKSSGDDSGPPTTPFLEYLSKAMVEEPVWLPLFAGAGLATALVYWLLATQLDHRRWRKPTHGIENRS